jgi:hypothetical protein
VTAPHRALPGDELRQVEREALLHLLEMAGRQGDPMAAGMGMTLRDAYQAETATEEDDDGS